MTEKNINELISGIVFIAIMFFLCGGLGIFDRKRE